MPQPIGQDRGNLCPSCKLGRLVVQTKTYSDQPSDIMRIEIGRAYAQWTTVKKLCCNHCSQFFKAKDEGVNIKNLLDRQLENFISPNEQPTTCPVCENTAFAQGKTAHSIDAFQNSSRSVYREEDNVDHLRKHYLYCADCFTVVFRLPDVKSKATLAHEAKMESDPEYKKAFEKQEKKLKRSARAFVKEFKKKHTL